MPLKVLRNPFVGAVAFARSLVSFWATLNFANDLILLVSYATEQSKYQINFCMHKKVILIATRQICSKSDALLINDGEAGFLVVDLSPTFHNFITK